MDGGNADGDGDEPIYVNAILEARDGQMVIRRKRKKADLLEMVANCVCVKFVGTYKSVDPGRAQEEYC